MAGTGVSEGCRRPRLDRELEVEVAVGVARRRIQDAPLTRGVLTQGVTLDGESNKTRLHRYGGVICPGCTWSIEEKEGRKGVLVSRSGCCCFCHEEVDLRERWGGGLDASRGCCIVVGPSYGVGLHFTPPPHPPKCFVSWAVLRLETTER